jgi:hypothetical protein
MRAVVTMCLLGLAGCSFDLGSFRAGSGGAGAGSEAAASSASTSNASTAVATSSSAGGSSSSAASSDASSSSASGTGGAGGSPVALAPCAGFTDDFQNFPDNWQTQDASRVGGSSDRQAQADIELPHLFAGAWLDGQQYSECYLSIELVGLSGGNAYLNLYQDLTHFTEIYYDGDEVQAAGESADPGGLPHAIAIAFHGSQVYYLYMRAGETTWQPPLAVKDRPGWMDDGADDSLGFGDSGIVNDSATFDDFNVNVVTTADLQ